MKIYSLIPAQMYRDIAAKHNLNGVLRDLFSPLNELSNYVELAQRITELRAAFTEMQLQMIADVRESVIGNLPLLLIRDKSSNYSGSSFFRWRNAENNKGGQRAWESIMLSAEYEPEIKLSLAQMERERIAYNMQISLFTTILRQLGFCQEKLEQVDSLLEQGLKNTQEATKQA